jgi:ribonuclease BN (tRNA processing enzyme)
MRLTVVGCAGSVPGPASACSCYLVEQDGYRLLLDLGIGAAGPLQAYAAAAEIDAVIVSHTHDDHWADLVQLGYLRTLDRGYRPLPVLGPSDLPAVLRTNPEVYTATVATPQARTLGPLPVRMARVDHDECWATRVGDALCYTADSGWCPALDELADGCRTLLAEASGLDADGPLPRHLTAGDAGRLAARSGAEVLILTHLRPWQDPLALLDEAARLTDCPVLLAQPGLRVALRSGRIRAR